MKNPTSKDLASAVKLNAEGKSLKEIIYLTGLNYSQAKRAIHFQELKEQGLILDPGTVTAKTVEDLRAEGISWGEIATRCQIPESRVRKQFAEKTGLKSQGQRIGKGGRFYYDRRGEVLYSSGLKATGTSIPVGAKYDEAVNEAHGQQMIHMDMADLRAKAAELGIRVAKKPTKARLVVQIRKALEAAATPVDA